MLASWCSTNLLLESRGRLFIFSEREIWSFSVSSNHETCSYFTCSGVPVALNHFENLSYDRFIFRFLRIRMLIFIVVASVFSPTSSKWGFPFSLHPFCCLLWIGPLVFAILTGKRKPQNCFGLQCHIYLGLCKYFIFLFIYEIVI